MGEILTVTIPKQHCRSCGHLLDAASGLEGTPKPGSVTLCIRCGTIHLFTPKMRVRLPTDGEMLDLMLSKNWGQIMLAQKTVRAFQTLASLSRQA